MLGIGSSAMSLNRNVLVQRHGQYREYSYTGNLSVDSIITDYIIGDKNYWKICFVPTLDFIEAISEIYNPYIIWHGIRWKGDPLSASDIIDFLQ